jgi:hypothetical protein
MDFAKWQTNFVHAKVVFGVPSNNLLSFALLSLWLVEDLHKTSPFWVYAINKQITYLEYTFPFTSNSKYASSPHNKPLCKHIQVIFLIRQSKMTMSYPKPLVSHNFKND